MSQGTRSQVKQMEVEQQLSTLITMVQTVQKQQNRQQELCRGLKVDMEGLTAAQLDQASRLEDLGQQQETRVMELIHKQDARWLEIEQRQLDA